MLLLSLFPGIGLLDMAFEDEGFCIVRGPDLLWGGDIRRFHPPAGRFDGVIGGPPCQCFSRLRHLNPHAGEKHGNMIPEYERCVTEAQPEWFVMENVPDAPVPVVPGYIVSPLILNNRWIGEDQNRVRRFSFGTRTGLRLNVDADLVLLESMLREPAVCAGGSGQKVSVALGGSGKPKRTLRPPTITAGKGGTAPFGRESFTLTQMCELQGLPGNFLKDAPFTSDGKRRVIGNGVPLPMGRAIARAVKAALAQEDR